MKVGCIRECRVGETRVAISPETAGKFCAQGAEVLVESGAGGESLFPDEAYSKVGASVLGSAAEVLAQADLLLKVRAPEEGELRSMKKGAALVGILEPNGTPGPRAYAEANITAFAMEFAPRITRAQSMDVLSSQANLAGYKAVLEASTHYSRMFPMMMTAAGAIAPARVFIMGVGVAGLQAIATAKRLGAIVSATDVRAATKEQVESLGATFVMVEDADAGDSETAGGYAKETSEEYRRAQEKVVSEHIAKQDIVITAAFVPGRPAPKLVTREMLSSMRDGSIVVDLAVEQGGNCEGSQTGEVVVEQGVKLVGLRNMAGRLPADASALYARNLFSFAGLLLQGEEGAKTFAPDWDDEIIQATLLTRDGAVVHPNFQTNKGAA